MTETQFAEAQEFWLLFQANTTFRAVHEGCLELGNSGLTKESPLYFPLIAGLICLYGRPFKINKGLDKGVQERLRDEMVRMVPEEYGDLHKSLITIRDKLYAHSDAAETVTFGPIRFGELRSYRDKYPKPRKGYFMKLLYLEPEFFRIDLAELARLMEEKTRDHVGKLEERFADHIPRCHGEFLLNIKDKDGPIFTQVEPELPRED